MHSRENQENNAVFITGTESYQVMFVHGSSCASAHCTRHQHALAHTFLCRNYSGSRGTMDTVFSPILSCIRYLCAEHHLTADCGETISAFPWFIGCDLCRNSRRPNGEIAAELLARQLTSLQGAHSLLILIFPSLTVFSNNIVFHLKVTNL